MFFGLIRTFWEIFSKFLILAGNLWPSENAQKWAVFCIFQTWGIFAFFHLKTWNLLKRQLLHSTFILYNFYIFWNSSCGDMLPFIGQKLYFLLFFQKMKFLTESSKKWGVFAKNSYNYPKIGENVLLSIYYKIP